MDCPNPGCDGSCSSDPPWDISDGMARAAEAAASEAPVRGGWLPGAAPLDGHRDAPVVRGTRDDLRRGGPEFRAGEGVTVAKQSVKIEATALYGNAHWSVELVDNPAFPVKLVMSNDTRKVSFRLSYEGLDALVAGLEAAAAMAQLRDR